MGGAQVNIPVNMTPYSGEGDPCFGDHDGVVQVVQDGVGQGGFVDELVPFGDGKLGCGDEAFAGVAVQSGLRPLPGR